MQDKQEHRSHKLQMIEQWQQSGLSQKDFCAATGIVYHVFHYWYGVYRSEKNSSHTFVPVQIKQAVGEQQITVTGINGIQIQVPFTDMSVCFIKQLLS